MYPKVGTARMQSLSTIEAAVKVMPRDSRLLDRPPIPLFPICQLSSYTCTAACHVGGVTSWQALAESRERDGYTCRIVYRCSCYRSVSCERYIKIQFPVTANLKSAHRMATVLCCVRERGRQQCSLLSARGTTVTIVPSQPPL